MRVNYKLKRYYPNYMTGFDEEYFKFKEPSELYNCPWLKTWKEDANFIQFSLSDKHLMVEYKDGSFWVVGNFNCIKNLDLPAINFDECKKRKEI